MSKSHNGMTVDNLREAIERLVSTPRGVEYMELMLSLKGAAGLEWCGSLGPGHLSLFRNAGVCWVVAGRPGANVLPIAIVVTREKRLLGDVAD